MRPRGSSPFKILIVDDFEPDIHLISNLVRSCRDIGVELIGACRNGIEALEFVESTAPDIVIADIEMPHMGGVELARHLGVKRPKIKVVFCSLHDEFEYARQALYLHNYGYILKPPDPTELRRCLASVTGRIASESSQQADYIRLRDLVERSKPVLVEALVKELVFGLQRDEKGVWEQIEYLGCSFAQGTYTVVLVEIDDFERITAEFTVEQSQVLSLKIAHSLIELASSLSRPLLARIDDSHLVLLVDCPVRSSNEDYRSILDNLCARILGKFETSDISLSLAVSMPCRKLDEVSGRYRQCTYLMRHKFTLGKGKAIFPDEIPHSEAVGSLDYNALQKDLRFALSSGTAEQLSVYLDHAFAEGGTRQSEHVLKNTALFLALCAQALLLENGEDLSRLTNDGEGPWERILAFETRGDLLQWLAGALELVRAHVQQRADTTNRFLVEMVRKYISSNYAVNISLKAIAPELSYSPNYLNHVFKQSTGETIFEYSTRYRIEKARELLDDPSLRIHEVGEAVGYSHSAYFSSVFRKYVGVTPREYREKRAQ